jgi:lipoprotein-anchoring transpeptidase ErfK/SrfK
MADYYSVLSSAVAKLENNVETARRVLYDRARKAVTTRMRVMDPPVSDDAINAELAALEAAIARVEGDIARPVEEALHAQHRPPTAHAGAEHHPGAGVLRGPARRPGAPPPSALGDDLRVEPLAEAEQPPRRARSTVSLVSAIAAVVLLIIAALAYVYWPKQGTTSSQQVERAPAPVVTAAPSPAPAPAPAGAAPSPSPSSGAASRPAEPRRQQADAAEATIPYILRRQLVFFRTTYPVGTMIVIKPQHSLYLVKDNGTALRYAIAVGADCDSAAALLVVDRKDGGPAASAPVIAAADRPTAQPSPQPRDGGPAAVPTFYFGDTPCRIRSTNVVSAIGQNPPSGGFQLFADDMLDLYDRVPVGTKVVVTN